MLSCWGALRGRDLMPEQQQQALTGPLQSVETSKSPTHGAAKVCWGTLSPSAALGIGTGNGQAETNLEEGCCSQVGPGLIWYTLVKAGPHTGCHSWQCILSISAVGTATSWASAAMGTVSELILVSTHHRCRIPPSCFIFKLFIFKKYFFTYYFLLQYWFQVGVEQVLVAQNKNWNILLLKTDDESFDPQEFFHNESLTWIISRLYSKVCLLCYFLYFPDLLLVKREFGGV